MNSKTLSVTYYKDEKFDTHILIVSGTTIVMPTVEEIKTISLRSDKRLSRKLHNFNSISGMFQIRVIKFKVLTYLILRSIQRSLDSDLSNSIYRQICEAADIDGNFSTIINLE
mgnify:CR=1 FL=1